MAMSNEELHNELEVIRAADPHGRLRPEAVIDVARDPSSPLHERFEWDDSVAAEKHRLAQARQLIRVVVTKLPNHGREVRAYCSLTVDRGNEDGDNGYRSTVEVLGDEALQALLLADAMKDLETFQAKYANLRALGPIFVALREVEEAEAAAEERRARRRKKKAKKKRGSGRRKKKAARSRR